MPDNMAMGNDFGGLPFMKRKTAATRMGHT
jgi:hypothetical protein